MTRRLVAWIAAAILALAVTPTAHAKKPPSDPPGGEDPPPTGTIYFLYAESWAEWRQVYAMDGEGNNIHPVMPAGYVGVPSLSDHTDGYGTHKWWVNVEPTNDGRTFDWPPDGSAPATAIYASTPVYDASGAIVGLDRFELALGDSQKFRAVGWSTTATNFVWTQDADGNPHISWLVRDYVDGHFAGFRLLTIPFEVDENGLPVLQAVGDDDPAPFYGVRSGFDWAPDGSALVMDWQSAGEGTPIELWVMSDAGGSMIYDEPTPQRPSWSPVLADGATRILFRDAVNIYTVNPDGSDLKTVVPYRSAFNYYKQPNWSSDGAYIAYILKKSGKMNGTDSYTIMRSPAGGGDQVDLIGRSIDKLEMNILGWR